MSKYLHTSRSRSVRKDLNTFLDLSGVCKGLCVRMYMHVQKMSLYFT